VKCEGYNSMLTYHIDIREVESLTMVQLLELLREVNLAWVKN
jgi:hypothetical protein